MTSGIAYHKILHPAYRGISSRKTELTEPEPENKGTAGKTWGKYLIAHFLKPRAPPAVPGTALKTPPS